MPKKLVTLCLALTLTLCVASPAAASGLNTSEIISAAVSWVADIFKSAGDSEQSTTCEGPDCEMGPVMDPGG